MHIKCARKNKIIINTDIEVFEKDLIRKLHIMIMKGENEEEKVK